VNTDKLGRIAGILRYVLLALALGYLGLYLILALLRIGYPYELEWREGGAVDQVMTILDGHKLYVSPELEFVPYTYTPLYFYVSAVMARILGLGFLPLRLVSLVSSLGCFCLIYLIVKRETASCYYGLISAGLFAAAFRVSGAWFDVARVDSLFLVLLLAAVYLIRFGTGSKALVAAGILVCLSFLAKQTALVISLPLMLYAVLFLRWRAAYFVGTAVTLIAGTTLILNSIHDGWYYYWIFVSPRQHSIVQSMLVGFWTTDILVMFVAAILALVFLWIELSERHHQTFCFYLLLLGGALLASWMSRLSNGGYNNVLMPAYATLSVLFGLGMWKALERVRAMPAGRRRLVGVYIYLICIIQFLTLRYDPVAQVPTRDDSEAGDRAVHAMSQVKGEIFVPYHGYLPVLAGKQSFSSGMAYFDMQGDRGPVKQALVDGMRQAIREQRFDAIVLDERDPNGCWCQ
jgi:4-amino-4-deoxy-L-arabinose transferase-like glycosyltransferase